MRYTSLLIKRLLCFLLTVSFVSFTILAQPDISGKAKTERSLTDLNIAPFGIVRSWHKIADPLGKTLSYKEFNSSASADTSDIGIFWWDARDIKRIEVVYDANVPAEQPGLPIIQYWQQSWPETPPRMPSKEDLEDDAWQGGWVTAAACSKILLFVRSPFEKPIRHVTINGQEWKEWDAEKESIVIPQTSTSVKVAVSY